ncbi:MAG: ABC-F family ATP-binding cassette domain-containing protein, partial [Flammeovirgaceae bacterium]|nr:ABC-F family ATP-binding cassette domain-containing protein [Flammeovirgaceae bacterium]
GEKIALVARNGAGKTTLLNIITQKETADKGKVAINQQIKVGFLTQMPFFPSDVTVGQYIFQSESTLFQVVKEYEVALANYQQTNRQEDLERLEKATQKMQETDAWNLEAKVKKVLSIFGIEHLNTLVTQLSGGQQKRLALAKVLIEEPDFLILDEPTNHLDLDMIEWLEEYLMKSQLTLLLVTHDRYFLDRVCQEILELENQTIYRHKGNYSYYIEQKAIREEIEAKNVEKAKTLMRKELEWVRRMPKARGTKAKYRLDAFEELKEKATSAKKEEKLQLSVKTSRLGGKILELKHITKKFGEKYIVKDFSYAFKRKEKIGIVGKNGVGKTTFLKLLTEMIPLDAGSIEKGETVVFGYYQQEGIQLAEDKRVIEVVKEIAEFIPMAGGETLSASQLLQRFLFSPEQQYAYVSTLSGGERRRLYLLTILVKNPNFLILDEPTNDLDLLTLSVLEDFLERFEGCLLVVSHDRYFMDKLVDHLLIFEGDGKIVDFNGKYTEYRQMVEEAEKKEVQRIKAAQPSPAKPHHLPEKKKLSYHEQKEYESIQKEIESLEKEKQRLIEALSAGSTNDYQEIKTLSERIQHIDVTLEEKMLRWIELDEKLA